MALIFLEPFLLQSALPLQGPIVLGIFLLVRFNHLAQIYLGYSPELQWWFDPFPVIKRALSSGSFFFRQV